MTSGVEEFSRQLTELGHEHETKPPNWVLMDHQIATGRFAGQHIRLGFEVPLEFPRTPPHGPHFSPCLLPVNPSLQNHPDRVHPSSLGTDWGHWSRNFPNWKGKEGVAGYLAFVAHLFVIA
jgi:hypothetical protein